MAAVTRFGDLVAWQKARALCREITVLVEQPPVSQKYAFRDQTRRAAVSVMSNIAEGFDRGSRAEFHHMLSIAKGSCADIDNTTFTRLRGQTEEVSRIVGGLRASVARQRAADRSSA